MKGGVYRMLTPLFGKQELCPAKILATEITVGKRQYLFFCPIRRKTRCTADRHRHTAKDKGSGNGTGEIRRA